MIPYEPIRFSSGIPEYNLYDVNLYGVPDHYGIYNYIVIESHEKELVMDYKDEIHLLLDGDNIHRYDRIERFTNTFFQLIGRSRIVIPHEVISRIKRSLYREHPSYAYSDIKDILKYYGYKKYYNRIPCILRILKFPLRIRYTHNMIIDVQNNFKKINENFEHLKKELDVKYFPSIRYVALYLMEKHGFIFEYEIPKVRVKKIEKKLQFIVEKIDVSIS